MSRVGEAAVLILAGKCYILAKPGRRGKGLGCLQSGKFDFRQNQSLIDAFKNIKFNSQILIPFCGKKPAGLCQYNAVSFFLKDDHRIPLSGEGCILPWQGVLFLYR